MDADPDGSGLTVKKGNYSEVARGMEAEWADLVGEVIGQFAETAESVEYLFVRLKNTADYGEVHSMWVCGAGRADLQRLLARLIERMGFPRINPDEMHRGKTSPGAGA